MTYLGVWVDKKIRCQQTIFHILLISFFTTFDTVIYQKILTQLIQQDL